MDNKNTITISTSKRSVEINAHNNYTQYYSEKAEASANKAEASAKAAKQYVDSLVENEEFKAVASNLDLIEEVGEKIETVDFDAIINAETSAKLSAQSALASAETSTAQANISTAQAEISTQKAIEVSTNVNLANNFASQSLNSSNIAKEQATISTNQATISTTNANNSLTYSRNAKTSEENALKYSNNAKTSETNALNYSNKAKGYLTEIEGKIPENYTTVPIGSIIPVLASSSYIPNGYLPCNGAEYNKEDFEQLWKKYLIGEQVVFDPDSITVVGSPTITDDGVASGFSVNDYLKNNTIFSMPKRRLEISTKFIVGDVTEEATVYSYGNGDVRLTVKNSYIQWIVRGNADFLYPTKYTTINNGDKVKVTTIITEGKLEASISINGTDIGLYIYNNDNLRLSNFQNQGLYIGVSQNLTGVFNGSIDLKQFSIEVDRQTVFDCLKNQPLLNTCTYAEYDNEISTNGQCSKFAVKPFGYDGSGVTIVGNPTITEDGIASGLNKTNYITLPSIDVSALKWKLQGRIKPTLAPNNTFYITNLYLNVKGFTLYRDVTGGIVIDIVINVDNVETRFKINTPVHWELGKAYDFFIQRNNGIFSFGSKEENELNYTVRQSEDKGNYPLADGTINLMQSYDTNDAEFDLKQFKVEVDGQTVFDCVEGNTFKVPKIADTELGFKNFVVVANGYADDCLATWNTLVELENYLRGV